MRKSIAAVLLAGLALATTPAHAQWSTPMDVSNATTIINQWFTQQLNEATQVLDRALRAQSAEQTANTQATAKHQEQIADAQEANAELRARQQAAAQVLMRQRMTPDNVRIYCMAAVEGNQTNTQRAVGQALAGTGNDRATMRSRTPMTDTEQFNKSFKSYVDNYCDPSGAKEGVCTLPANRELVNADIRADNVFNRIVHTPATAEAAQRFAETVAEPMPAEQISPRKAFGDSALRPQFLLERNQSQRASLITTFFTDINWRLTPTATATKEQKAAMSAAGYTPQDDKISWTQTMESLVAKRFGNDTYFTTGMARDRSAENLLVELNQQAALSNRLNWETYQLLQKIGGVIASGSATLIVNNPAGSTAARGR